MKLQNFLILKVFRTLILYKNGYVEEEKNNVSIFLKLEQSDSEEFSTKYGFEILGRANNKNYALDNWIDPKSIEDLKTGYGDVDFIDHNTLFDSDKFVECQMMTFVCKAILFITL